MAVKTGSLVKFHYTGKLTNGEVFGGSVDKNPLECKVGEGRLLKGVEKGLVGMEESEKKEIVVSPDEGYGQRVVERIVKVDKSVLGGKDVKKGEAVEVKTKEGNILKGEALAIEEDGIVLDFNHPLAGKTIIFEIEVVEVSD